MHKILIEYSHPRGTVRMVKTENGETWELQGECNRCGECCDHVKMPIKEFRKENDTCKHFSYETVNGEKMGKCAIIWHRPAFCMLYPDNPHSPLPKECGYKWERIK